MKLYKFRSLADCKSVERVEDILRTGELWCSKFWEMNDPMEGIYRLNSESSHADIEELFEAKANRLICSFSGVKALCNPLMWGYYANGFMGVAIEVEVDEADAKVKSVEYGAALVTPDAGNSPDESVQNLLCRKLNVWSHEDEKRFIISDETERRQVVGEVTGVVIGHPYPKAQTHRDSDSRWEKVRKYHRRVRRVVEVANDEKLDIYRAQMKNAKVGIVPWPEVK